MSMTHSPSQSALEEFFAECDEIIQRVSSGLQQLEKGPAPAGLLDQVYRDMHTMKGSAQLFGIQTIAQLAHAMEACLDPIRKQKLSVEASFIDVALKSLDLVDRIAKGLRSGRSEADFREEVNVQVPKLIDEATALFQADYRLQNDAPSDQVSHVANVEVPVARRHEVLEAAKASVAVESQDLATASAASAGEAVPAAPVEVAPAEAAPSVGAAGQVTSSPAPSSSGPADTTVRVQVGLLDRLMNLVGELVLVRNQVTQYTSRHDELEFINMAQSLSVVTSELQNEVMLTRMQPIGGVVNKFQRVVRDLARDLSKKIDITIQGAETELDKTLLEAIKDPLTHIVRNACDHGIETLSERKAAGKPESGHLMIRAFHDGGQIFIEVSDDGRGLDRDKIIAKAIEKNVLTPERAAKMSDREICQIIFLPGFSTAKQVTNVSGRGVGMDVVKSNIERIGGSAEVVSTFKKGSTVRLKIPLTLAIVPALLVRRGHERFAIPQVKLVELVRVDPAETRERIELLQGRPMYRLRGNLLPIVLLDEALKRAGGVRAGSSDSMRQTASGWRSHEIANIVVLNAEGELFGLLVDEILDTADIVVKPLGSVLKKISVFSGATLLGDGSVALILDVLGLAELAQIDTRSQRRSEQFMDVPRAKEVNFDAQELLLVRLKAEAIHAIPLCLVSRLEEFPREDIEVSGAQQVVQYRNGILPILSLNHALRYQSDPSLSSTERVSVVVVSRSGRSYGIAVDEVLDVVTSTAPIDDAIRDRPGIMGNVLMREEVIVVVDVMNVIDNEMGQLGGTKSERLTVEQLKQRASEVKARRTKILFAEDVAFFRKQVVKVLTSAGYEVHAAVDGEEALNLLMASGEGEYSLVLSDIEMPKKTGLELARDIRSSRRFDSIPLVALTTRYRSKDIEDGKKAGFDAYLEKLNSDVLLSSIHSLLARKGGAQAAQLVKAAEV